MDDKEYKVAVLKALYAIIVFIYSLACDAIIILAIYLGSWFLEVPSFFTILFPYLLFLVFISLIIYTILCAKRLNLIEKVLRSFGEEP